MNCCQCQGIEEEFGDKYVHWELSQYREKGANQTTRMLVDALKAAGVQGRTLLDIGAGLGAIEHELIAAGVSQATDVDASRAYIQVARTEANRRGIADRIHFEYGDFVDIAPQVPSADIVTLDRVVCCYHDMKNLVELSAARAGKLYGLVYPRDTWWARLGVNVLNLFYRLRRKPFRTFVHPTRAVDAIVRKHGFQQRYYGKTPIWQVVVYSR